MIGGNDENQFRQYAGQNVGNLNGYNAVQNDANQVAQNPRVQNVGNQNGLIGVLGNANLNGNGNMVEARAKGNVTSVEQSGETVEQHPVNFEGTQPLVDDLYTLFETWVDTYDASTKENFNLCAFVLWTINDYPGLGTLCGCPYRGFKGCVVCGKDTQCLGIKPDQLFARQEEDKTTLPLASYTLTNAEKDIFYEMLCNIKVPQGYCSNFSSLVSIKDRKLIGLKSHDYHMLMQEFLPIAIVKGLNPPPVLPMLSRLKAKAKIAVTAIMEIAEIEMVEMEMVKMEMVERELAISKDSVLEIVRYLKGKPHLGLWYPKGSLFNLVAYSDSDYAGASLDRKSTTGGCQFLGVNTPRCDEDSLAHMELMVFLVPSWKKVIITEDTIRQNLRLDDADAQFAQPSSPPHQQPSQPDAFLESSMTLLNILMKTCATLTQKVVNLEQDKIAQALEITKLKQRVRKLEKKRRTKHSGLKRLRKDTNKAEPGEVEEVLEVVTSTKLMTEVVTTAAPITTVAQVSKASAPRRRRGVVIQDPKETATSSNKLKRSEKQDNAVIRYQALKRKPVTEGQARKNMMIYLKNMADFKMDFFKVMTYSELRPIFEK
nr:hypothetical protein [Tanacetum cinerariifolium]